AVAINDNADRWSIINVDGEITAEGPFHKVHPYHDGTAVADGQLIDLEGKVILKREDGFVIEDRFADSRDDAIIARRVTRNRDLSRYVILRRSTAEHLADIPNELSPDGGFFHGLAMVRDSQSRKCGYISREGRLVIPADFHSAERFRNGFAEVGISSLRDKGVINSAGEVIWKPTRRPELPPEEAVPGKVREGIPGN
ncbi:MAG: WG repeat-containing protein, partial [Akkermansiaceae bacterium]|nr:WG repeat-containing protein [Akkermansiaceae bacterium]